MHGLDLFSGYGGITLALSEWVIPVAYCEIDRYAQGILLSRMSENKLPIAPIWDNIQTFSGKQFRGKVDIVYGGFPCQDISTAGNGSGLEGERSGLFFELCRVVKEVSPIFIFLENVPAIRTRGLREVVVQLTNMGYDCQWTSVSALEVGANHVRKRWFLLGFSRYTQKGQKTSQKKNFPNANDKRLSISEKYNAKGRITTSKCKSGAVSNFNRYCWRSHKSKVDRVDDGCSNRVDRIKALGNGVVPLQAKTAFEKLIGYY